MAISKKKILKDLVRFLALIFADLFSFYLSVYLAFLTRAFLGKVLANLLTTFKQSLKLYTFFWGLPFLFVLVLAFEGLYTERRYFWDEFRAFIKSLVIYFFLLFTILSLTHGITRFSRGVLALVPVFLVFLFPLFRYLINVLLFKLRIREKCQFIGSERSLEKFEKTVLSDKYAGFELGEPASYVFLSTSRDDFDQKLRELQQVYRYVYIFDDGGRFLVSEFKPVFPVGKGITMFELQNKLLDPKRMLLKRIIEVVLAVVLLPVLLPLIFLIGVAIILDSKGPIFYSQQRIGRGGRPFKCLKFRTMYIDADLRLKEILAKDEKAREEWTKYFKLKNDPRVTRIGKFLRKTSLDELPQIFNVLKGEMSFVGPRPVLREELEKYYREFSRYYFEVRPGITGLWQISGRNELDYEQRVKLDVWYVLNWSLWLDFVIFVKTIKVVLSGKGAY
ncbi:MAG: exopolysaccharide biosynthesis polyprenyl glycosylphosphotransferase [bacterium]|nr:exopolysaccharide biosynthesis polyprenyl glycosylphosphotransferase [bacterium]